jgi:hypothetical protein
LLAKGGSLKKRPSTHLHKAPTQSNKVRPWTLQMALVRISFHTWHYFTKFSPSLVWVCMLMCNWHWNTVVEKCHGM